MQLKSIEHCTTYFRVGLFRFSNLILESDCHQIWKKIQEVNAEMLLHASNIIDIDTDKLPDLFDVWIEFLCA